MLRFGGAATVVAEAVFWLVARQEQQEWDLRSQREACPVDNLDIRSQQEETCAVMEEVGNHLGLQTGVGDIDSSRTLVGEVDIHASVDNLKTAVFVGVVHWSK